MPNGDEFDGSELDQGQAAVAPAAEQGNTVEQPAQVQPPPQQTTPGIPEQFQSYTPEQWFQEWNKANSMVGRYKQEVSTLRQQNQTLSNYIPQVQNRQPNIPTSLPGQEARPGQNLDELYYEKPTEVLRQVVSEVATKVLQDNERQQQIRQYQSLEQRRQWISSVDDDELQNLRLDESVNFTPEHEAVMEALAKRDPEVAAKLNNPNLSEQDIRGLVRGMYSKADKILKGQLTDPEKVRALNEAQKLAAANGAPGPKAGTQIASDQIPEAASNYRFLFEG
ncbi:MAG: hypothetical protein C4555_03130 [Dehalococcoidia bacterium]|nr:MAG: hypothetical protein C4555_03130 [Dehalococcoidia bacterium]